MTALRATAFRAAAVVRRGGRLDQLRELGPQIRLRLWRRLEPLECRGRLLRALLRVELLKALEHRAQLLGGQLLPAEQRARELAE